MILLVLEPKRLTHNIEALQGVETLEEGNIRVQVCLYLARFHVEGLVLR